jgi:hypothetical protein
MYSAWAMPSALKNKLVLSLTHAFGKGMLLF